MAKKSWSAWAEQEAKKRAGTVKTTQAAPASSVTNTSAQNTTQKKSWSAWAAEESKRREKLPFVQKVRSAIDAGTVSPVSGRSLDGWLKDVDVLTKRAREYYSGWNGMTPDTDRDIRKIAQNYLALANDYRAEYASDEKSLKAISAYEKGLNDLLKYAEPKHKDAQGISSAYGISDTELEKKLADKDNPIAFTTSEGEKISWRGVKEQKDLSRLYGLPSEDLEKEQAKSGSGVAYTTMDGQNITWNALLRSKKKEEQYADLSSRDDWDERSKYKSTIPSADADYNDPSLQAIDWAYELVNNPEYSSDRSDTFRAKYMTDEEREVFNYIYHTEGKDAALRWQYDLMHDLEELRSADIAKKAADYASQGGVQAVGAWLGSRARAPLAAVEYIGDLVDSAFTGRSVRNDIATRNAAVDKAITDNVDMKIGNFDVFDFGYGTATSMVDSALSSVLGSIAGPAVLGLSAAASATNAALDRGMDQKEAVKTGVLAGFWEGVFEHVSIGNFKKLQAVDPKRAKDYVFNTIKSMGINASEEGLTEIANAASDIYFNGDFSDYETSIRMNVQSGMTQEEARKEANKNLALQIAESAASGALMGIGFGAGGSAIGHAKAARQAKQLYGSDAGALVQKALEIDPENAYAHKMQEKLKNSENNKLSGSNLAFLAKQNEAALVESDKAKIQQAAKARLTELGATEDVDAVADALMKQAIGEKLTRRERDLIELNRYAPQVAEELDPAFQNLDRAQYDAEWAENHDNRWVQQIGTERINAEYYNRLTEPAQIKPETALPSVSENIAQEGTEAAETAIVSEMESVAENATVPEEISAPELEEGKAILNLGGEVENVDFDSVNPISAIRNGRMVLRLADGRTVSSDSVTHASADTNIVYNAARMLAPDAKTANVMVNGFKPGMNVDTYIKGIRLVHMYGKNNFDMADLLKSGSAKQLSADVRTAVYKAGQIAGGREVAVAQARINAAGNTTKATGKGGRVLFTDGGAVTGTVRDYLSDSGRKLKPVQEAGLLAMEKLAAALKTDLYVFESYINKDGKRVYIDENGKEKPAPNGFYDGTGKIFVDLNAGNMGEGTMLYTVAHELTHFIKEWSPAKFKTLANIVVKQYNGESIEKRIAQQIEKAKRSDRKIDYDTALEEVVADSMESILADGNVLQMVEDIKKQDRTLGEKIAEWFKNLAEELKSIVAVYSGYKPDSIEGQFVAKLETGLLKQIEQLYTEGLVDAADARNAVIAENQVEQDDAKYSIRDDIVDVNGVEYDHIVELDYKRFNKIRRNGKAYIDFIRNNLIKQKITVLDGNGNSEVIEFAGEKEKVKKDGAKNAHPVIGELTQAKNETKKLVIVNSVETAEISHFSKNTDEHSHQWLDENGWEERTSFVMNRDGTIYPVTLHIAKTRDGRNILYDVNVKIKEGIAADKNATSLRTKEQARQAVRTTKPSDERVSQSDLEVKSSLRNSAGNELSAEQQVEQADRDLEADEIKNTANRGSVKYSFGVTQEEIDAYIDDAYTKQNTEDYKKYAEVSKKLRDDVLSEIDVSEYTHVLRDNDIRHIRNSHGENTNEKYPVTKQDLKNIPWIIENYDKVYVKTNAKGTPGLVYVKVGADNVVYYVEAATTEYHKEKLLVNKQMVKAGFDEIPNLHGLIAAIDKKEGSSQYLADLQEIRKAYVRDVKENYPEKSIPLSEKKVNTTDTERLSDRDTDSVSNRSLLANAFEGTVQNDIERGKITEYREKMSLMEAEEQKLHRLNAEIKELSFAKGPRDKVRIEALRTEAQKTANRINVYDGQLLRLEASKPLQEVLKREKAKAYDRAEKKGKAALQKQREAFEEKSEKMQKALSAKYREKKQELNLASDMYYGRKISKLKAEHKEQRENERDRRNKTAMRGKIHKVIGDLDNLLNNGNKKNNVKSGMQGFATSTIASAKVLFKDEHNDVDIIRDGFMGVLDEREASHYEKAKEILAQIDALPEGGYDIYLERSELEKKLSSQIASLRDALKRERILLNEAEVSVVLDTLANEYFKLKDSDRDYVKAAYQETVYNYIKFLQSDIGGAKVRDMTLDQLQDLYKAYTMAMTTIRDANKSFVASRSVDEIVDSLVSELETRKMPKSKAAAVARNLSNSVGWDYEKLYYALQRIGSDTLTELFTNLANAEDIVMADVKEANAKKMEIVKKYGYNNWNTNEKIDKIFADSTGKEFQLSLGELMSLYAYSRREGAWNHIEYGGFVFGKTALTDVDPVTAYKLTKEQCESITNTLSEEQKHFVEEMQTFLSDTMGAKGNEVSMQLYGIEMFGEKNYFPVHVAGQFMARAQESQAKAQAGFSSMTNAGFTQAQNKNAKAPFVMESFMDVWADHVNEMSRYHGTVPALEDIRKVMNYSSYSNAYAESVSVQAILENKYGKEAVQYFNDLYQEANSGAITDKLQKPAQKWISKFRKNSVAYSASVLIQQPASIVRAYAMLPMKYFRGKGVLSIPAGVGQAIFNHSAYKKAYGEMLKYAPGVTLSKEIGGFDTASGNSIRTYLLDTGKNIKQKWKTETDLKGSFNTVMDVVDDNPFANLPNVADKIAWIEIWNACKRETAAKNGNLKTNSDEFMQLVGKRFTEVIRATQVYDSMFSKSPLLKSKNVFVQSVVSFMNEPNTTANMIENAIRIAVRGNGKAAARTITAVAGSIVLTSVLKSIVYAMRDDDEEKNFIEKYVGELTSSLISDFSVFNYIPYARDVWSVAQGFDVERSDMAILSDAINFIKELSALKRRDTDEMTEDELIEFDKKVIKAHMSLLDSVCAAFRIPEKNIRREIKSILNVAKSIYKGSGGKASWASIEDAVLEGVKGASPSFMGPKIQSKGDKLYEAIISGDTAYADRLKGTYKDEDAVTSAIRKALGDNEPRILKAAELLVAQEYEEALDLIDEIIDEGNFTENDVESAVESEVNAMTEDESEEETAEKAKSTVSAKDYVNAVLSGSSEDIKAVHDDVIGTNIENGKTEEDAEKNLISGSKTELKERYTSGEIDKAQVQKALTAIGAENVEQTVLEWTCEVVTGKSYDDHIADYKAGLTSASELSGKLTRYGGLSSDEAKKKIVDYSKDAYENGAFDRSKMIGVLVNYGGKDRSEAESVVQYMEYKKSHPDVYVNESWIDAYNKEIKSSGLNLDTYVEYREQVKSITGDGKKERRMAVIHSLPISNAQKDALYLSEDWTQSRLYEAPWH